MRTIETNLYSFSELSDEAKENAIESVRNSYYEGNDFASWAIDNCSLLEPLDSELSQLLGTAYNFPLIENTREKIYFDTDRNSFLDCENAMKITNDKHFLLWLGIDTNIKGLEDIEFNIFTPRGKNSDTTIEFDSYNSDCDYIVSNAIDKFNNHISDCLDRIKNDIDYQYTDEAIEEEMEANEYEFTEDGTMY